MKLQRREKILAYSALGIVALVGLYLLFMAGDSRSNDQLVAEQNKLSTEISTKQHQLKEAAAQAKRVADWRRRALPPDPVLARSLYQNWLRELAARAHFRGATLTANESVHHEQSTKIACTLRGRARLGDVVDFMYEFYKAGYLHQIRKLDIKPVADSRNDLDVNCSIEAFSMATADSKDRLPKEPGKGLLLEKLADYQNPIVKRNFFAVYVPLTPPPPQKVVVIRDPPKIDRAKFAVITGFTEVDGTSQVWLQDRMGGKSLILSKGETFKVGEVNGTVESIQPEGEAIFDLNGHRLLFRKGDSLRDGKVPETPQQNASAPPRKAADPQPKLAGRPPKEAVEDAEFGSDEDN